MNLQAKDYFQYAFLSAFTTMPKFKKAGVFYEEEIAPIFNGHRDALREMQRKNNGLTKPEREAPILYKPVPYCLFGDFDMAVFSLIDDFSFATKKFKPSADSIGFKYQVNTGIIPLKQVYTKGSSLFTKFKNKRLPEFFNGKKSYPFTGIATIKLNSAMIVGVGQDFLDIINVFLLSYLDNEIKSFEQEGIDMFYIINENLGWNELSIHFFGNSIQKMQELLFSVRKMRLEDVQDYLEGLEEVDKFDKAMINSRILPKFRKIESGSLLKFLFGKRKKYNTLESHPVIATSITYGYHPLVAEKFSDKKATKAKCGYNDLQYDFFMKECEEKMIKVAWNIKPGHELKANKAIQKCIPRRDQALFSKTSSGRFPYTYPKETICFREYLGLAVLPDDELRSEIIKHVVKFRSRIQIIRTFKYSDFSPQKHFPYDLDKFKLGSDQIRKAQDSLREYPIPYIYKSQIENLIINFNDAISDPLMYNYFIGLKPGLKNFLAGYLKIGRKDPIEEVDKEKSSLLSEEDIRRKILNFDSSPGLPAIDPAPVAASSVMSEPVLKFIQTWNKAYWNRYFHSYYFNEINDFNIEHHGGIQQLLLTYDVLYKLISKRVYGDFCKRPFINVGAGHVITSTEYFCTVNFTHLFRPAVFASECVHEAVNHVIQYLTLHEGRKEFGVLHNPHNEMIDVSQKSDLERMEKKIRDILGPIDEAEVEYMQESFGLNTIRHFTADYLTYKLAYEDPSESELNCVENYYHTHWFTFLMRADLYSREDSGQGAWFFKEDEFKTLFVRLNLVFHLGLGYDGPRLMQLNNICPSVELKPLWESEKKSHVEFVLRLGKAITEVMNKEIVNPDDKRKVGVTHLINMIDRLILQKGSKNLSKEEMRNFDIIIEANRSIMCKFSDLYEKVAGVRYNSIKRLASNVDLFSSKARMSSAKTNVEFYKNNANQKVFIDPKGNLFSTSPKVRQDIYATNILYIKNMWDHAMKIMINDYKQDPT